MMCCGAFAPAPACLAQLTGVLGAHDPSNVVQDGANYYYFATGQGLVSRTSTNLTAWSAGASPLPTVPSWIAQYVPNFTGFYWAPDVIKLNNLYYLYYSASQFGTKTSAIGYATSPALGAGAVWTDHGEIVHSGNSTNYNAIDPSLMLDDATGRLWMTWGSFNAGIFVTELNPTTGAKLTASPIGVNVAAPGPTPEIEGAAMIKHDGLYYLFANWGGCCSGVDSTYNIRVGRSASPTGPFLDRNGVNMLSGGGTLFLDDDGRKIGPGHFSLTTAGGQEKFGYHYYNGDQAGAPLFGLRNLYWTSDAWPSVAAVNPDWAGGVRGDWSLSTNWSGGVVPDGPGHIANFALATAGNYGISLGASGRTVGVVNLRGSATYLIGNAAGPTLTLDNTSGETATVNVAEGSHTIAAPVAAVDGLGVNVTPTASTLTLSGGLAAPSLSKYGKGNLTLSGTSTIGGSLFVKYGSLTITGPTSTTAFSSVGQIVGETGVLSIQSTGALSAAADLNIGDTGDATTPATGTLNLGGQGSVAVGTSGGFYVGSGFSANTRAEGTVNQSGGALTVNRPADGSFVIGGRTSTVANGRYNLSGGTVTANTNVFVGGHGQGSVTQTGGAFNAAQFASIGRYAGSVGTYTISGGTLSQSNAGAWLLVGEEGQGTLTIQNSGLVESNGTVRVGYRASGSGTINLDGGTLAATSIVGGAGSSAVNFNGGVLRAAASGSAFVQSVSAARVKAGGAVIDTQAFNVTIAQSLTHDPALGVALDGGLNKTGAGALTLSGANSYSGLTTINGGTLIARNTSGSATGTGAVVVNIGGTLAGTGTVAGQASVASGGSLAPGIARGILTVGGVAFASNANFAIELAGSGGVAGVDFDRLVVAGNAALGGDLNIIFAGGFAPTVGDTFRFLDVAGSTTGTFDGLIQGALVTGTGYTGLFIDYQSGDGNDVALVAAPLLAGDFNLDGKVDGVDFLRWQRGESPHPLDPADLAAWSAGFGATTLPLATTNLRQVPEPAAAAIASSAVALVALRTRFRNGRRVAGSFSR